MNLHLLPRTVLPFPWEVISPRVARNKTTGEEKHLSELVLLLRSQGIKVDCSEILLQPPKQRGVRGPVKPKPVYHVAQYPKFSIAPPQQQFVSAPQIPYLTMAPDYNSPYVLFLQQHYAPPPHPQVPFLATGPGFSPYTPFPDVSSFSALQYAVPPNTAFSTPLPPRSLASLVAPKVSIAPTGADAPSSNPEGESTNLTNDGVPSSSPEDPAAWRPDETDDDDWVMRLQAVADHQPPVVGEQGGMWYGGQEWVAAAHV
ncbi:hypothetical protein CC86DRAFT_410522 [Ophiobolus disseminans]|uniref:Uncharacterized protein n=1 Tax=Ophiobolus disseminans TaxID=1469910 RepID=A0A6A6ZMN0_9PLEO|nr:hypothetical protein CC86DRAFT_410522 [Ophiobolus disseminans]